MTTCNLLSQIKDSHYKALAHYYAAIVHHKLAVMCRELLCSAAYRHMEYIIKCLCMYANTTQGMGWLEHAWPCDNISRRKECATQSTRQSILILLMLEGVLTGDATTSVFMASHTVVGLLLFGYTLCCGMYGHACVHTNVHIYIKRKIACLARTDKILSIVV